MVKKRPILTDFAEYMIAFEGSDQRDYFMMMVDQYLASIGSSKCKQCGGYKGPETEQDICDKCFYASTIPCDTPQP